MEFAFKIAKNTGDTSLIHTLQSTLHSTLHNLRDIWMEVVDGCMLLSIYLIIVINVGRRRAGDPYSGVRALCR